MLILWLISDRITGICDAITIDRDTAAGLRAAGFFIGSGLILGRAAAGDWHSADQTVTDFLARGWPVLLLWIGTIILEFMTRPTPERPTPDPLLFGFIPSFLFVAIGVGVLLGQGHW
jgi:hypothetical protein